MSNNKFIEIFNIIFNKIPHIYSEIFLKIFNNNYIYFIDYNKSNNLNIFSKVLESTFYNIKNLNNKSYFYNYFLQELSNNNILHDINIINNISNKLAKPIEDKYLLNIIDNNSFIKPIYKDSSNDISKLYSYFLISKTIIKIINLLTFYNNIKNIELKKHIHTTVEKYRTLELNMDYVLDDYNYYYNHLISKINFKILIYLLSLSKNGQELEKKYYNEISKLLDSIGYQTNMQKIIDYHRINNNIKPYIYTNINKLLNILFYKYHDNYNFISHKEVVLKTCFYLYIKELFFKDKIIISITYSLWQYEWDSIKKNYEIY